MRNVKNIADVKKMSMVAVDKEITILLGIHDRFVARHDTNGRRERTKLRE